MDRIEVGWLALFFGAGALVSTAQAQDAQAATAAQAQAAQAAQAVQPDKAIRSPFASRLGSPAQPALDDAALAAQRGAAAVTNIADTWGTVNDTTAINVVTGSNTVTEASFSNASGLSTVIQNTGANVLIQNSTIVNVQFKP